MSQILSFWSWFPWWSSMCAVTCLVWVRRRTMVIIEANSLKYPGSLPLSVGAMSVCFMYSILFMKLWSYVQVNMWCRQDQRQQNQSGKRKRTSSISIAQLRELDQDPCWTLNIFYYPVLSRERNRRSWWPRWRRRNGKGAHAKEIGAISGKLKHPGLVVLPLCTHSLLWTELPTHFADSKAIPVEAHSGSCDRSQCSDGPVPAVDDPFREELLDTVHQYGYREGHGATS